MNHLIFGADGVPAPIVSIDSLIFRYRIYWTKSMAACKSLERGLMSMREGIILRIDPQNPAYDKLDRLVDFFRINYLTHKKNEFLRARQP